MENSENQMEIGVAFFFIFFEKEREFKDLSSMTND